MASLIPAPSGALSPTDSQGLPGAAAAQLCLSIRPSARLSPRLLGAAPGSPRFASPAPEPELPPARRLMQPRAAPFRAVGNYTTAKELPVGRRRPGNGCVAQIAAARSHSRSCAGKLAQTFDSFLFFVFFCSAKLRVPADPAEEARRGRCAGSRSLCFPFR